MGGEESPQVGGSHALVMPNWPREHAGLNIKGHSTYKESEKRAPKPGAHTSRDAQSALSICQERVQGPLIEDPCGLGAPNWPLNG